MLHPTVIKSLCRQVQEHIELYLERRRQPGFVESSEAQALCVQALLGTIHSIMGMIEVGVEEDLLEGDLLDEIFGTSGEKED